MGVGFRLKALLREKGMTIKQLAELSGISLNTLYSITKRDTERVDYSILVKIAEALNISVLQLQKIGPEKTQEVYSALEKDDYKLVEDLIGAKYGSVEAYYADINQRQSEERKLLERRLCLKFSIQLSLGFENLLEEDYKIVSSILDSFTSLNKEGHKKMVERIEELLEIPKYTSV